MNLRQHNGRIIKLIISIGVFTGDSLWRLLSKAIRNTPHASQVVLYYHDTPEWQRQKFARQMDLVKTLTIPLSTEDQTELRDGIRYSTITFDDGFENCLDNAVPELLERNIPATFFVTIGFAGRIPEWWPALASERLHRIASCERWQQLTIDLFKIGSHTLTHPHLALLTEKQAREELQSSRAVLERLLGRKILSFSFPYGEFTADLVEWCYETGYEQLFTTTSRHRSHRKGKSLIERIPADPDDWPIEFRLKLLGAYRWLPLAVLCKRWILSGVAYHGPQRIIN